MISQNLIIRIVVSALAIPAVLWISYQGGAWLFGMVLCFSLIGIYEFLTQEKHKLNSLFFWMAIITVFLSFLLKTKHNLPGFSLNFYEFSPHYVLLIFFVVTAVLTAIKNEDPKILFEKHSRLVWGVAYITLLYPYVYLVGQGFGSVSGGDALLFLFALLWVGDTAAMGTGTLLGKHKLAPTVSPNKTVEGFVGGLCGAVAVAVIIHFTLLSQISLILLVICALGASLLGQLGDLVESMWKRSLGIKDSSGIIPGHGGLLDRFDSLLFAAPFVFYFFKFTL